MNVAELIEELKKQPQDAIVAIWVDEGYTRTRHKQAGYREITVVNPPIPDIPLFLANGDYIEHSNFVDFDWEK